MIDIRDVILEAQAEVQEIMREVVTEIVEPQIMAQVRIQWAQMPDNAKEDYRIQKPQEYAELQKILRRTL